MSTTDQLPQVSEPMRQATMRLVWATVRLHPEARTSDDHCGVCKAITEVLQVLEDDQRQYGPPLDKTDPSYNAAQPANEKEQGT